MIGCHDFDNGFLYYECPNCNDGDFVPEDVYDQIKGNFFYDVKK